MALEFAPSFQAALGPEFDIVTFDPRGTGTTSILTEKPYVY